MTKSTTEQESFTTSILVDQSPKEVFNAISNVRGWWSEEILGATDKLNSEFLYRYQDVHRARIKIIEFEPSEKVVWEVLENHFSFTADKEEWTGTRISFEIGEKNGKTQLVFTHIGLNAEYECYDVCFDAWTNYITKSLRSLITEGKGQPNPKEGGFNEELIEKFNIQK